MRKNLWSEPQGRIPAAQSGTVRPFVMKAVGGENRRDPAAGEAGASGRKEAAALGEAHRKGFQEGVEAGAAQVRQSLEAEWNALSAAAAGLTQVRERILQQAEEEILALALHAARKILRAELEQNPEGVVGIVREAVRKAVDREVLKISVNARDFEILNHRKPDLLHGMDGVKKIVFEVDESIEPGGCLIETRFGDVDARIDRQIEVIDHAVRKISQTP
ncbi:MAG: hypothetical protein HY760_00215 [Nitrospirae bacterium]|nr:hypothetical protein [Nitrospirota bacterium]